MVLPPYYAIILVCNLVFGVCDLHQNPTRFDRLDDCKLVLADGLRKAHDSLPGFGDEQVQYEAFGWCGPLLPDGAHINND